MDAYSQLLWSLICFSLFYRNSHLASCTDTAGAQAQSGPSWTPGNNHVEVDLSVKQSGDHVDYESKAGAHVFTTKDGFFIGKVVATTADSAGNSVKRDVTTPNNHDARRVILYTIQDKGPQLEVIYAHDLDNNNNKFQSAITYNVPYGPDVSAKTPATPPAAPTATPAEQTAPDAYAQPMAQQPMAQAAPVSQQMAQPSVQPMAQTSMVQPAYDAAQAAPMAGYASTGGYGVDQSAYASVDPDAWAAPAPQTAPVHSVAAPAAQAEYQAAHAGSYVASQGFTGALAGSSAHTASLGHDGNQDGVIKVGVDGRSYADFTLDEDEDEKEGGASASGSGFQVREVHHSGSTTVDYDSDEDDYEIQAGSPNLTTYVHTLGHRVADLELRMEPLEDKVDFLTKITQYQHELMEINNLFKSSDVFKASMAHGMAPSAFMGPGAPLFRSATHEASRVLDHSQFPSDLKLYIADPNDANALVELDHNDLTVKTENSEVSYTFKNEVKCNVIKLEGRTVWNHRDGDLHPNMVAYYPLYDKVVLDFEDSLVMFVKKPDPNAHHQAHEEVTLSHHVESEVPSSDAPSADPHAEGAAEGPADAGLAASHGTQEADANGHSAPEAGSDATPANETASSVVF